MFEPVLARRAPLTRRALLVASALALALIVFSTAIAVSLARPALSRARDAVAVPDLTPAAPLSRLTYLTETATSTPKVWIASLSGGERKLLGPGQQPLLAPDGRSVAVSLFGTSPGVSEHGPSLGIYPAEGGPIANYLSLETATATPLAWSPDSRYLAVYRQSNETVDIAAGSGLDVIDTQSGAVTSIAEGAIYGASFARDGSDRLVFALAHSLSGAAATNLYVSEADGVGLHRITSNGRSLNPVWGPKYIAYDRERLRHESPEYQIWLASPSGASVRQVTRVAVGPLVAGLVPLAFSADGSRLLAEFEGEDTSNAYAVNVASGRARSVNVHGRSVQGAGISSDGSTLLIDEDAFEQAPSNGRVATIPFAGGPSKILVAHGSQASWNG